MLILNHNILQRVRNTPTFIIVALPPTAYALESLSSWSDIYAHSFFTTIKK